MVWRIPRASGYYYNRGWVIYGSGTQWEAWRYGVRLRSNTEQSLCAMIDTRPNFWEKW